MPAGLAWVARCAVCFVVRVGQFESPVQFIYYLTTRSIYYWGNIRLRLKFESLILACMDGSFLSLFHSHTGLFGCEPRWTGSG